jgi:carboxymethylenebutenolidase
LTRRQALKAGRDATTSPTPDADHGFFADYRPSYNAEASADAWNRCVGLFGRTLKT